MTDVIVGVKNPSTTPTDSLFTLTQLATAMMAGATWALPALTVNSPAAGMGAGIIINQSPAGTASMTPTSTNPGTWHNKIDISNWNVNASSGLIAFDGVRATIDGSSAWCGSGAGGFGYLAYIDIRQQSATAGSFHTGVGGMVVASVSHPLPSASSNWGITGVNGNVIVEGSVNGVRSAVAAEFDIVIRAGAERPLIKNGVMVNIGASDMVSGLLLDAAYSIIAGEPSGPGVMYGYLVDSQFTSIHCMNTAGILFGSRGAQSVGYGIDISSATCATAEFKSQHALIDGSGRMMIGASAFGSGGAIPFQARVASDTNFTVSTNGSDVEIKALNDAFTAGKTLILYGSNFNVDATGNAVLSGTLWVGGNQVVGARRTGWGVATGTPSRATYATSSVTLPTLAGIVMALEQDLIAHGLIG
jgi:hypothetical protein